MIKLPESAPERKRSFGGTAVSTMLHMSLIGGAVLGTHRIQPDMPGPPSQVNVIYQPPPAPRPPLPSLPPATVQIPTLLAPPELPPTVDLSRVPDGIPPALTRIGTTSLESFATTPRPVDTGVSAAPSNEPFFESAVEKPVVPLPNNPAPVYPRVLAAAGSEGTVHAQFVVDTTGRIEEASIRILGEPNPLFARAVREAMKRMRFVPAEVGQRRVRQLVEQAFAFAMRK
jgi:periplasmic protein TonB